MLYLILNTLLNTRNSCGKELWMKKEIASFGGMRVFNVQEMFFSLRFSFYFLLFRLLRSQRPVLFCWRPFSLNSNFKFSDRILEIKINSVFSVKYVWNQQWYKWIITDVKLVGSRKESEVFLNYQLISFSHFISPLTLPPHTLLTPHYTPLFCYLLLSSNTFIHFFIVLPTVFWWVGSFFELPTYFFFSFHLSSDSASSHSPHTTIHFTLLLSSSLI